MREAGNLSTSTSLWKRQRHYESKCSVCLQTNLLIKNTIQSIVCEAFCYPASHLGHFGHSGYSAHSGYLGHSGYSGHSGNLGHSGN